MEAESRTALVTGASRGIGASIAASFAKQGLLTYGTATTEQGAQAISAAIKQAGGKGEGVVWQASDSAADEELVNAVPSVDVLVCNAAVNEDGMFLRMKDESLAKVLEVNLASPFRLARHYVRKMASNRFGRIVMISSVVATLGNAGQANYVASKAGLEGVVRSVAREVGGRGVTVNAVAPGFVETDMTNKLPEKLKEKFLAQIPVGRIGEPEEIAAVVSFLASPAASYITGATIPVNGGLSMS